MRRGKCEPLKLIEHALGGLTGSCCIKCKTGVSRLVTDRQAQALSKTNTTKGKGRDRIPAATSREERRRRDFHPQHWMLGV